MRERGHHDEASTAAGTPRPNPRQQQVLELAAIGLSDDEIAARLKVSRRTIRYQFEKLFRTFGVRNRSDAVAMWMDSRDQAARPVDECPYPRPSPENFADCPAYAARQVVALDERSRPAGRMWTCQHLEGRLIEKTDYRWYGACVLGDVVGRNRWAERAGLYRVRMINHLLTELAPLSGHLAQRLWKLKGDQARALAQNLDPSPATKLMGTLAGRYVGDLEAFFEGHRRLLEANQLAIDESLARARSLIDRILEPGSPAAWDDRFDVLMGFPEDVWAELPSDSREDASHALSPHSGSPDAIVRRAGRR